MSPTSPDQPVTGGVQTPPPRAPVPTSGLGGMSMPVKVGIVTTAALTLLGAGIFWLGNFKFFGQTYQFRVWFPEVAGLGSGARVQLMGVRIGEVKALAPTSDRVVVNLEIENADTRIQRDATITIGQNGLLGEKVVDIQPNKKIPLPHPGEYIAPDSLVEGHPAPSLTAIVADIQYAVRKLRTFVDDTRNQKRFQLAINRVEHATQAMSDAMDNVVQITAKTNRIVGRVQQIADAAPASLNAVMANARVLTADMDAMIADIRHITSSPENQRFLGETARNLAGLTERMNLIMRDLQGLTGDSGVQKDLKVVLHDARETMQNAAAITKSLKGAPSSIFSFNASGELLGSLGNDPLAPYVQANVIGQLNLGANGYVRIGLEDIGGRNLIAAQYGLRLFPPLDLRFGLLRGKLGAGSTIHMSDSTDMLLDVFDPRTPAVRATVHQGLFGNWGLTGFYQRTLHNGVNEFGLGLRWKLLSGE